MLSRLNKTGIHSMPIFRNSKNPILITCQPEIGICFIWVYLKKKRKNTFHPVTNLHFPKHIVTIERATITKKILATAKLYRLKIKTAKSNRREITFNKLLKLSPLKPRLPTTIHNYLVFLFTLFTLIIINRLSMSRWLIVKGKVTPGTSL